MPIERRLARSIHDAVGMTDAEMETEPGEYVRRFVQAGVAIVDLRARQKGDAMVRKLGIPPMKRDTK